MKNFLTKKNIIKFIFYSSITYLFIEVIEYILFSYFHINSKLLLDTTNIGIFLSIILLGFKCHIWCCILPFLYGFYKCKHGTCNHKH